MPRAVRYNSIVPVSPVRTTSTYPRGNPFTPPIPQPTTDVKNLAACVEALKACVESLIGQRGDAANRAVTFNDLIAYGLLDTSAVESPHGDAGDITAVLAGTGLTGGGESGRVTLNLDTPVSVSHGGTGAATAPAALANLGGAPLASPLFTGDPRAPTPSPGDADTSVATTAFVGAAVSSAPNKTITLSGDATGSGTAAILTTITGLQGRPVSADVPAATEVLTWNGLVWEPTPPPAGGGAGGGDIDGVIAGTGLSGGGTVGTVTLSLSTPVTVAHGGTGASTHTADAILTGAGAGAIHSSAASVVGPGDVYAASYSSTTPGTSGGYWFNDGATGNWAWYASTGGSAIGRFEMTGALIDNALTVAHGTGLVTAVSGLSVTANVTFTQTMTGAKTAPIFNYGYSGNYAFVDDKASNSGDKLNAFGVRHTITAGAGEASRNGFMVTLDQSATTPGTDPNSHFYNANLAVMQTTSGDGGTAGTPKGDYIGVGGVTMLFSGAANVNSAKGAEFDTSIMSGASAFYHCTLSVVLANYHAVRGSAFDAAISMSRDTTTTQTWQNGIVFGDTFGYWPFASDSTLIVAYGSGHAARRGIDWSGINFAEEAIYTTGTIHSDSMTVGFPAVPSGGLLVGDVNAQRLLVNGLPVGAGGLSGMTAGQIPIAASATTVSSSANLSGDITSNSTLVTSLATVNANVGTFQGITVNGKGLVTGASNQNYLTVAGAATTYAPLASPTFTGDPKAPTPTAGDNDTSIATTAFVGAAVAAAPNQTITLGGDLSGSGTSSITATLTANSVITADITNSNVTYPKIQNVTAARLLGNPTGSAAAPSEISLGTNLSFAGTVLNAAGGGSTGLSGMTAGQIPIAATATTVTSSANLSGDVVSTATLATTIQANAVTTTKILNSNVTYAKIQNVANNRLLGNTSGSAAAPSEIVLPLSAANGGTGLASGTSGGIPYFSTTTTLASSALLALGRVVTGGGAGAAPVASTATVDGSGNMTVTGQLQIFGAGAACFFEDRVAPGTSWAWYASTGLARLFQGGDKLTVDTSGNMSVVGALSAAGAPVVAGSIQGPYINATHNLSCTEDAYVGRYLYAGGNANPTLTVASGYTQLSAPDGANSFTRGISLATVAASGYQYFRGTSQRFESDSGGTYYAYFDAVNCYKPGGGAWLAPSDIRLKRSIVRYESGLAEIAKLRPVTYQHNGWGGTVDDGRVFTGLVADEVQAVMPELVGTTHVKLKESDDNAAEILTLDATPLIYALCNAVRELSDRVAALEG